MYVMPSRGYETIGLKPAILQRLQMATDEHYPGMFLPSALIIMMNEIKRGRYTVEMHSMKMDFSGRYTSLTLRSDVKEWLVENYENLKEEYNQRYRADSFTKFASVFMINVFESKTSSKDYVIKLKESDFRWLEEEYQKRRQEYKSQFGIYNFERFADLFLKDLFNRVNEAKKILTYD
jgi:hypothetical protein